MTVRRSSDVNQACAVEDSTCAHAPSASGGALPERAAAADRARKWEGGSHGRPRHEATSRGIAARAAGHACAPLRRPLRGESNSHVKN
eukprot:9504091-Pyramimonas_sp.AAC.2